MQPFVPGYFGKLPLAADFLSRHAGDDEALAFERWLQDGVRVTWERFSFMGKANQRALPSVRFVFWSRRPEAFLVGVLSQGRDSSGRRFPFSAFVQNRVQGLEASAPAFPSVFDGFFQAIEGFAHRNILSPPDLYAAVEESTGRIPSFPDPGFSSRQILEGRRIGDIDQVGSDGGVGTGRIQHGLEELYAFSERLAAAGKPVSVGVRLPLPDEPAPAMLAAVFWMEALRRIWRRFPAPPVCFWTAGQIDASQNGWLDAYTLPPEELAYVHLLDPGFVSDLLLPLAGTQGPATFGPANERRPLGANLSADFPLSEALDLVAAGGSAA